MGNNATAAEVEALGMSGEAESSDVVSETGDDIANVADAVEVPNAEAKPTEEAEQKQEQKVEDYKQEMIKRFGERPDNELTQQAWKSYRELEKEFDKRNVLNKEYEEIVSKFGGVEALRTILSTPKEELTKPVEKAPNEPSLPDDLQQLIDEGELDLSSRKDQMWLQREMKSREQEQMQVRQQEEAYKGKIQEARQTFETFLTKDIAPKYELADMNALKAKAYAGGFQGLSDEAFKIAVENEARISHERVETLAEQRKEKALSDLHKASEKSVVIGKSSPTPVKKVSMKEAFENKYAEYFGN